MYVIIRYNFYKSTDTNKYGLVSSPSVMGETQQFPYSNSNQLTIYS